MSSQLVGVGVGRETLQREGRKWNGGGGVGAKVTASAVCLCCFATHLDAQHIVAGMTFQHQH